MSKKKLSDKTKAKLLKKFGFEKVTVSAEERGKFHQELAFLFSAKQEVIFSNDAFWEVRRVVPTNSRLSSDDLRLTRVAEIGIRLDILKKIIEKYVPIVSNTGSTCTMKRIIDIDYIRRIGGPSSMLALIKVNFSGMISEECWEREGFYVLRLDPRNNGYDIKVEKLNEKELICENVYVPEESEKSSQATTDYRDILAKIISENYSSKYQFCKATGMDEAFLSNVLSKRKHFSLKNLEDVLEKIGYEIDMVKKKSSSE